MGKIKIILGYTFLLILFLLAGCTASTEQKNSYRQISMDEAVRILWKLAASMTGQGIHDAWGNLRIAFT